MVENMSDGLAWFPKLGREDTELALEFINIHIHTLEPEKMQMWQNYYSKHIVNICISKTVHPRSQMPQKLKYS